ncbi:MAG: phosphatase PAP2 family protein [Rhizobiaceae bacterium]
MTDMPASQGSSERAVEAPNLIVRSYRSLSRLLVRLADAPRYAHQGRNPVLPISLIFYALVILALILLAQVMQYVDGDLSRAARAFGSDHRSVRSFFMLITKLGSTLWILIPTLLIGLTLSVLDWSKGEVGRVRRLAGWYTDINFIFFTVLISGLLAYFIKNTIGRARPKYLDLLGHDYFDFGAFQSGFASFPSGHSTTFGAFCMGLALLFPRYNRILLAAALLGGLSRVMVGAHYLSDVLAGLAFGAGLVWVSARYLARRDLMFRFRGGLMPVRKR